MKEEPNFFFAQRQFLLSGSDDKILFETYEIYL